jgi:CHAD domain-containing protein
VTGARYQVGARFAVPDLDACLPRGGRVVVRRPVTLTVTYYDAEDLRLARAGVFVRHRRGEDRPWAVELPTGVAGVTREIAWRGAPSAVPAQLLALVTVWRRRAPIGPVAVLRTARRRYELCDASDTVLAEVVDDRVSVLDGRRVGSRLRELHVQRKAGGAALLERIRAALAADGVVAADAEPLLARALGPGALSPPAPPAEPGVPAGAEARAADVLMAALRGDVARILRHDPLVRLREAVGAGDTAVHQMRAGCRRLRGELRTFGRLLDPPWSAALRAEVGWVTGLLGAARDAEVLRDHLRRTAAADPLAPLDEASVARLEAELAARHEDAFTALDEALESDRYLSLVDMLLAAGRQAPLTALARAPAGEVLPRLAGAAWRELAYGRPGSLDGTDDLAITASDEAWHRALVRTRRARYATEAVAPVLGGAAPELARALGTVHSLLSRHQDATVAAATWLAIARFDPDDHLLAVTAGRLMERERATIRTVRAAFPAAWAAASRPRLTAWLG